MMISELPLSITITPLVDTILEPTISTLPASLWEVLTELKTNGYRVDDLPETPEQLLDLLQTKGVNLPNDKLALTQMADEVSTVAAGDYVRYFSSLPKTIQAEMEQGSLGYLHVMLNRAVDLNKISVAEELLIRSKGDLLHVLESIEHPGRERALELLAQLEKTYQQCFAGADKWGWAVELIQALVDTGIEGLRGWGKAPEQVMVHNKQLLLPGLHFGNVFIGPQPPRGWEIDEELLHANLVFPSPHQYLAFYHYLREVFCADALIHLGRHSTYEFLPRRRAGLSDEDYPDLISGDVPGIYPYIVDGVGEGIQAKRRGLAVIVDHLTPPLSTTPLYDELLRLRQLVESFESSEFQHNEVAQRRSISEIRLLLEKLNLREELSKAMASELSVRGITYEQVDDELLVHEVGHYLTKLQEAFMPMGLHIFGRDWEQAALNLVLSSMSDDKDKQQQLLPVLKESPDEEITALLNALSGGFVAPGKGNDPIRTPEALPTGRNFHALDGSLLPTRIGYALGREIAQQAREQNKMKAKGKEAVILWASDTVRDEGAMIAFDLDMLGIEPVWNSRGIVNGIKRIDFSQQPGRYRRDIVFTTSGLFRDLYPNQLVWLDRAVLLALDGSSLRIREEYPALELALRVTLAPLGKFSNPGSELLDYNQLAKHWVDETRELLRSGINDKRAGELATSRLFGTALGAYGAGVNRLAERSAAWEDRAELGQTYINRMGYAYGIEREGVPNQQMFVKNLHAIENTYLGRASNLYGLLDNNNAFDYLGGLSLAIETISGKTPSNFVVQHANAVKISVESLEEVLLQELRGQFLNPA